MPWHVYPVSSRHSATQLQPFAALCVIHFPISPVLFSQKMVPLCSRQQHIRYLYSQPVFLL